MPFVKSILLAVGLLAVGWFVAWSSRGVGAGAYAYLVFSLVGLVSLVHSALVERRKATARFDMLVAAETVIAYGILSLAAGLVLGVALGIDLVLKGAAINARSIAPLVVPFGEGLLIAALSPVFAIVLRNVEVLGFGGVAPAPSPAAAVEDASIKLIELANSLKDAVDEVKELTASLKATARDYEASGEAIRNATRSLGKNLTDEAERLGKALAGASTYAANFGSAIHDAAVSATSGTKEMTAEMRAMQGLYVKRRSSSTNCSGSLPA